MRGIDELDHYEMLEVARSASPGEIDRAYRMAQETWADGSLALYSIFEKRDASEIRARLDEAYRVLAERDVRQAFETNGFRVVLVRREFVLPINVHKKLDRLGPTLAIEGALASVGLLRLCGSPVTMVAER